MNVCGGCGAQVPEPGLYVVIRPDGPLDACSIRCGEDLDARARVAPLTNAEFLRQMRGAR